MKKTLYSLMLNDEVVREVDALAHRMGTNRSNLINQILAEYVNYTTPERRINDVLSTIQQLMSPSRDFVPFFAPNTYSMSLKSSLEYKYRPTVKYEVELYRAGGDSIGELTVIFRTQSTALIQAMTSFFRLWKRIEDALALTNKEVVDALGGLPAHKLHCSVLAEEAVKSAVKDYYDKNGIAYDKSKFPACEDCESCRMV